MDFIIYKKPTSSDKIVDDFLLCDYLEEDTKEPDISYNGIYVSSEDESSEKEEQPYQGYYEKTTTELNEDIECLEELEDPELTQNIEHSELTQNIEDPELTQDIEDLELSQDTDSIYEETDTDEEEDEIELQLEEFKKLIIQIEEKIHILETTNSTMITTNFFINKEKYNTNLQEISIFKNKKKEYEKSIEFIYNLLIIKNKLV